MNILGLKKKNLLPSALSLDALPDASVAVLKDTPIRGQAASHAPKVVL